MFNDLELPKLSVHWQLYTDMSHSSLWTEVRPDCNDDFSYALINVAKHLGQKDDTYSFDVAEEIATARQQAYDDSIEGEGTSNSIQVSVGHHKLAIYANGGKWRIGCFDHTRAHTYVLDILKEHLESY